MIQAPAHVSYKDAAATRGWLAVLAAIALWLGLAMMPPAAAAQNSCVGYCGGRAPYCYCDDACFSYGDCCSDVVQACYPPHIDSISASQGPTTGGQVLTLTGTNFTRVGILPTVRLGATPCPINSATATATSLRCTVPAGQGKDLALVVRRENINSNSVLYSYNAPSLNSAAPLSGPTQGGGTLTLTGSDFGIASTVTVGGANCPVTAQGHASVSCTLPEGEGAADAIVLTAGNQSAGGYNFGYLAPHIDTLSPTMGPPAGNTRLTLTGTNFGTASVVQVGTKTCELEEQSHASVECTLPEGEGTGLEVRLITGGQISNAKTFNYFGPTLTSVQPSHGPTAGNVPITIQGSNFTASSAVAIGSQSCAVSERASYRLICTLPAGQGSSWPVTVSDGGAVSNALPFNYDTPSIQSITAAAPYSTAGGVTITLTGENFGTAPLASVIGVSCDVTDHTHSRIECTLPAGEGSGSVVVRTGNLFSTAFPFTYAGPVLNGINPTTGATAGNTLITLTGQNFGVTGSATVGGNNCVVTDRSHSTLICRTPVGSGTQSVVVSAAGQSSNSLAFTYAGPSLASIYPTSGPALGGVRLTLTGNNFGTSSTVQVGSAACPVQVQTQTSVECDLPAGQGANLPVRLTTSAQTSNSVAFSYEAPAISDISSVNTNTSGFTLTLTGTNFGSSGSVTVGDRPCPPTMYGNSLVTCQVPPGQGADQAVVLTSGGQPSNTKLISYSPPSLAVVDPSHGPTEGSTVITLTGSNFGTAIDSVSVGGTACPVVAQSHTTATCTLPAGQGSNLAVGMVVGGQSSSPRSFSYDAPALNSISAASKPTIGGTRLTLTGSNFGNASLVSVGSQSCAVSSQEHGRLECTLPAGQGTQMVTVAAGNQTSNPQPFSYDGPQISSVEPAAGATAGNVRITIVGQNFGSAATVSLGGAPCPVELQTHTRLECTLPAGQGTNHALVVRVDTQSSPAALYSYLPPAITSIEPSSGPLAGKVPITLRGENFGTSGQVTVGGNPCLIENHDHTSVRCQLPAGSAGEKAVVIIVAGQQGQSTFLYADPTSTPTATATATPTPTPLCLSAPRADCKAPGRSQLAFKNNADDGKDNLAWTWSKGETTYLSDLGAPNDDTGYAFCVYQGWSLFFDAVVPAASSCDGEDCWRGSDTTYKYRDRDGVNGGVRSIVVKTGAAGRSSAQVKGHGLGLADVTLPPAIPVTAQLVNSAGVCWSATYSAAPIKSDSEQFKAKYVAP